MLKSQEYSNCHEPLSQESINGRYGTFKVNVTYKPCIRDFSILSYRVGLDPVATSYYVHWIEGPATCLARSYLTT